MTKHRERVQDVEISRIREHPRNIRTHLPNLDRLARSIKRNGIQVPLLAHQKYRREPGKQDLELIYGHRRLAAATIIGLTKVPVEVRPYMDDQQILLLMLSERERVTPDAAGVAKGVNALRHEFGMSDVQIAERLGVSIGQVWAWSNGQGDLPEAPLHAPGTPTPPHPTAGKIQVPGTNGVARTATLPRRRTRVPHVSVARLHAVLVEHDAGRIDAATVVSRMRGMVAGWEPES